MQLSKKTIRYILELMPEVMGSEMNMPAIYTCIYTQKRCCYIQFLTVCVAVNHNHGLLDTRD